MSKASEDTDEEVKGNPIVEAFRASQIGFKTMKPQTPNVNLTGTLQKLMLTYFQFSKCA